jgi:hypothetical protein
MQTLFAPVVHQYKTRANVEIEMRLGKINHKKFDTNIGRERFEKILRGLKKYDGWESSHKSVTTAYIKGDIRAIDDEKGNTSWQKKTKLKKLDCELPGQPLDVRLSIATETFLKKPEGETEFDDMRVRHRESFYRKNLTIDMTRVTGNPDDPDSEETESYECELEISDPKEITDDIVLSNIFQKVFDVLKLLA